MKPEQLQEYFMVCVWCLFTANRLFYVYKFSGAFPHLRQRQKLPIENMDFTASQMCLPRWDFINNVEIKTH